MGEVDPSQDSKETGLVGSIRLVAIASLAYDLESPEPLGNLRSTGMARNCAKGRAALLGYGRDLASCVGVPEPPPRLLFSVM